MPLYTAWEGRGFFTLSFKRNFIFFVCHEVMKNFAMTVQEGIDTLQDIFEQRNH